MKKNILIIIALLVSQSVVSSDTDASEQSGVTTHSLVVHMLTGVFQLVIWISFEEFFLAEGNSVVSVETIQEQDSILEEEVVAYKCYWALFIEFILMKWMTIR